MLAQLPGGQRQHVAHDLIHTHQGFCGRSSLEQRSDSGQNLSAANAVPQNSLQSLSSFGQIWRISCEPVQARIGAGDNTGQGLIDFVGDGGCQLPHSGDTGNPLQFGPRLLQGRLRTLALGDIDYSTHEFTQVPGWVEDRMAYNVNVSDAFVRMNDSVVQFEIGLVVDGFLESFPGPGLIVHMNSLKKFFESR